MGFAGVTLATALALAGLIHAAWQTEWGARALWQLAVYALPGKLGGDFAGGTLASGLHLRNLRYADSKRQVRVDDVNAAWRVSLHPLKLTVESLRAGRTEVTLLPTPPEPLQPPRSLSLPLVLEVRELALRRVDIRKDVIRIELRDILVNAQSDGRHHRLELQRLGSPFGDADARLRLDGQPPFALEGDVHAAGRVQNRAYRAAAKLSGTLETLGIDLALSGDHISGRALAEATPFAPIPVRQAEIDISHLDPASFQPGAPRADLDIRARLKPSSPVGEKHDLAHLTVSGPLAVINHLPGGIDQGLLPFRTVSAQIRFDRRLQQFAGLDMALLGNGRLTGSGMVDLKGEGRADLQATGLDLKAMHGALQPSALNGSLKLAASADTQHIVLALQDARFAIDADARLDARTIHLDRARLQAGNARLQLNGTLGRDEKAAYTVKGDLARFNPRLFLSSFGADAQADTAKPKKNPRNIPDADINCSFDIAGALKPLLTAQARLDIRDSRYAGLPMSGGGMLQVAGKRLAGSDFKLDVAGNALAVRGAFGAAGDQLQLHAEAPALDRLGFGLAGRVRLGGHFGGSLERPQVDAVFEAQQLAFGPHRLVSAAGQARIGGLPAAAPASPVMLKLDARGYRNADIAVDQLGLNLDGSYAHHALSAEVKGKVRGEAVNLTLAAEGGVRDINAMPVWQGTLRRLENRGRPAFKLEQPAAVKVASDRIEVGSTAATLEQARIALQNLSYDHGAIRSAGSAVNLEVARLLALRKELTGAAPPLQTDLVLDGSWDFRLEREAQGYLQVGRRRGDIEIPGAIGNNRLGLGDLQMRAELAANRINLKLQANSSRIGQLQAQGQLRLQASDGRLALARNSPISGHATASVPQLENLSAFAGPKVIANGKLGLDLTLAGTPAAPALSGSLQGSNLALTLFDRGIRLRDGTARIDLQRNIVEIRQLVFHGGKGTLRMTGSIPLDQDNPDLRSSIVADKLQLLADPSANLILSGRAEVGRSDGNLTVRGGFTADRGRFTMPETPAPQLGDDVVIVRNNAPPQAEPAPGEARASGKFALATSVDFDLGRDFRFTGRGADVLLTGKINIHSAPRETPQATGTVTIASGSVEAFDTKLAIERGIINFQGPFSNPNLNILAMRRNQEVAAGVQVTGNAQRPRVTLVSEPNVAEEQKLPWLIFGHASNNEAGQAQSAAQGAALALVNKFAGKNVAKTVGIDEVSIQSGAGGQQLVSLGKNISDRLTLGYKQSLTGAEAVLELTYRLSRKWSIAARGGTLLGLNLTYSTRFDSMTESPGAASQR